MENEPIRILQFVPIMQPAGIENFIMNLYRNINREEIQFDFVVHSQKRGFYDDEIEKLGGKIYRFTYKDDKNFLKYVKDLNEFFIKHKEYKIVHGNMQSMMPVYLNIAKRHNVPVRIAHAHNSDYEKTIKGYILHMLSKFSKYQSNVNFACSDKAGEYLFKNRKFIFIPNAINTERFKYNEQARKKIRRKLGIDENTLLVGNIGRFELQKNHERVIEIFHELIKEKIDAKLILLGEGKLENKIREKVKKIKLDNDIIFEGVKKNTEDYYSAMDLFLFPSLYEGLPVTGIEAQTSGLVCVMSNSITKEVNIIDQIDYLDLKEPNCIWAEHIKKYIKNNESINRVESYKKISKTDFDIKYAAKKMEQLYIKYLKKYD
jgi:hypothetical protein